MCIRDRSSAGKICVIVYEALIASPEREILKLGEHLTQDLNIVRGADIVMNAMNADYPRLKNMNSEERYASMGVDMKKIKHACRHYQNEYYRWCSDGE